MIMTLTVNPAAVEAILPHVELEDFA